MMPGSLELMIILAVFILLFGADKLPALARAGGQAIGEFHKGREQIEYELRESKRMEPVAEADNRGNGRTDIGALARRTRRSERL